MLSDVDDVHDIMDDIQEQTEIANEISNALSQPVGFQDVDEVIIVVHEIIRVFLYGILIGTSIHMCVALNK